MKHFFIPRADAEKLQWLKGFANKLATYAAKYGILSIDVADMQKGALIFAYWLDYLMQHDHYSQKLTAYKNEQRDCIPAGAEASVLPVPPIALLPGIFARAASLAAIIKKNIKFTEADGSDLDIIGAEDFTDVEQMQPSLTLRLISGGHPEILWKKLVADGIQIYVDRGDGNWVFLAIDTHPDYMDRASLPSGVTSRQMERCGEHYRYCFALKFMLSKNW